MVEPKAGELVLIGGALALDFANTAGGRGTSDFIDYLERPADLLDWAVHAGSIDARTAAGGRKSAAGEAGQDLLRRARDLREAIHRAGAAIAHGHPAPSADLAALRDVAGRSIAAARLAPASGGAYRFDFSAASIEAALLGPVALSAVQLLERGGFDRLKQCPGPDCGWLFHDASKNNSRRWCDMATCGNRTKGRRHRARH